MIFTTYFANLKNMPSNVIPIAICSGIPKFYTGLCYKKLAPKYSFFSKWKEDHNNEAYIEQFNKLVLAPLRQKDVVDELFSMAKSENIALVCYEKPTDFCHRHLVADWLCQAGYECEEFTKERKQ